jgi:hypothetical protein
VPLRVVTNAAARGLERRDARCSSAFPVHRKQVVVNVAAFGAGTVLAEEYR